MRKLVGPLPEKLSSFCSDDAVLRYLRARNWHVKKATKMLKETLKWRVEYKPEEICWVIIIELMNTKKKEKNILVIFLMMQCVRILQEEIADEAETGKIYRSSCVDKHGRPVLVMRPSVEVCFHHQCNARESFLLGLKKC